MSRLLPDRLAARFALLLTAALVVAALAALGLLSLERDRLEERARAETAVARLLAVAPLMDGADPGARARLARDLSRRAARAEVADTPAVAPGPPRPALRRLLARVQAAAEGRALRLGAGPEAGTLAVSIALERAGWLNAVLRAGPPPRRDGAWPALLLLGLVFAATLVVGLAFTQALARPLAALAAAARAAGRGDRAARVPETGARELREAAAAFNEMQARIAREDAERTRLVAALGHDLRTPISSLRIRTEMLEEAGGTAGEEAGAMLSTLHEMEVMAEGLMSYARGRGDAEPMEQLDLAPWLERLAGERGAGLGALVSVALQARPVALGRAVGNLIDNALRYAGAARVTLARADDEAVIAVEDDGPGIPEERLDDMLKPFVRGDASRSAQTGGMGMGLAIACAVAESHGGRLTLANRLGGLRAEIRVPLMR